MFAQVAALLSAAAVVACTTVGIRDTEEPKYTVTARLGSVEIRQYAPRIAAETVVEGPELEARNAGFRRVADYIFGGNHARAKIAMTAPVAQEASGSKIAMTVPVAQDEQGGNRWRIRFFMPAQYTMETLPDPNSPDVKLAQVPPETMAVLQFSGTPSPEAVRTRTTELVSALEGSAWRPAGAPVAWFYDPPWTIPSLRRNEVAIPVSPN